VPPAQFKDSQPRTAFDGPMPLKPPPRPLIIAANPNCMMLQCNIYIVTRDAIEIAEKIDI